MNWLLALSLSVCGRFNVGGWVSGFFSHGRGHPLYIYSNPIRTLK